MGGEEEEHEKVRGLGWVIFKDDRGQTKNSTRPERIGKVGSSEQVAI